MALCFPLPATETALFSVCAIWLIKSSLWLTEEMTSHLHRYMLYQWMSSQSCDVTPLWLTLLRLPVQWLFSNSSLCYFVLFTSQVFNCKCAFESKAFASYYCSEVWASSAHVTSVRVGGGRKKIIIVEIISDSIWQWRHLLLASCAVLANQS